MLICKYCADKLMHDKDVARSALNKLQVIPTPDCIQQLNVFEKSLIKYYLSCVTVIRLGQISNTSRPQSELNAALKGRIAYLPLDVKSNAEFLPPDVLNTDGLVLLVAGQPTKNKKVWTSVVDLRKVHKALMWLKKHNHFYQDIPAYSAADLERPGTCPRPGFELATRHARSFEGHERLVARMDHENRRVNVHHPSSPVNDFLQCWNLEWLKLGLLLDLPCLQDYC